MTNEAFAWVKIYQLLRNAGWELLDGRSVRYEYLLEDGGKADYVLFDRFGRALAVLEAKSTSVSLGAGDLGAAVETWLDGQQFNADQLRLLHLVKEQIKANAGDLTVFEIWRFDMAPLSMNGGFERARAIFGSGEELERVLRGMNEVVFGDSNGHGRPSEDRYAD